MGDLHREGPNPSSLKCACCDRLVVGNEFYGSGMPDGRVYCSAAHRQLGPLGLNAPRSDTKRALSSEDNSMVTDPVVGECQHCGGNVYFPIIVDGAVYCSTDHGKLGPADPIHFERPGVTTEHKVGDEVNHPVHYNDPPSSIECIEVVRHHNFNVGSAIKYLWRAGLKGGEPWTKDLKKAIWYLQDEVKRLEKEDKP